MTSTTKLKPRSGGAPRDVLHRGEQTWQQTKSQLTRTAVLEAALDCFYEQGFAKTTTENVAQRAGVSRGAMLHHFPSRFDLVRETVLFINQRRIEMFAREEFAVQQGARHSRIGEGIDTYWRQLNTPEFIVFHELKVAARTDPELAAVVTPAIAEFEAAFYAAVKDLFSDLAASESFYRANFLTQFALEGMALDKAIGQGKLDETMMFNWLKEELKRSFQDVSDVRRTDVEPAP